MEGFTYQQIKDLQQLITCPKDSDSDSDSEDLKQRLSRQKISPGDIGKPSTTITNATADEAQQNTKDSNIWHPLEVNVGKNIQDKDPRIVPKYEMKFKQTVGTEDIFLGMNLKTPATASCKWLTILVTLPSEKMEKIELSVEYDVIDIRSPKYRLQLPTPFSVDPNSSSAKWNPDSECLELTLKLCRELDNINF
ncbi:PREDICTED: protein PIH1D3 [Ceratosolen solmsi marchali]|uniref:Protein PIH1D3 n=1 Tax=Ceratosolen solmsi marchali TaxID=326594 RepID=A0AAJ6YWS6_9HYME|nr:PREDICTED: protein PIH1D3 [Ceratosolen solmsi marchali]